MIINNAPVNEAVLSNVGEIGEFRIRNSAKAFNILSSGLYANKIRAIIRELSCNAVDSHVAAGKADTPFDVHLPNQLEPWFSIRDYGTGLTHEQVSNIYTTYFESTKTDSNEFIGALGLGSKSPFSYTDNFTVTAIKDGKRGVYSAFINGEGVPSIALMMSEETTDPAGVEVKFAVSDYYDCSKFRDEARHVYTYFKLRPVVSGDEYFEFREVEYETRDIIPGVHSTTRRYDSKAIMGNIAYPIDIPNAEKNLGSLSDLLNCGLEMHFAIGELDFQASREGLSYIPQTIQAIKDKLIAVNAQLAVHVAAEADKIENVWERVLFLQKKKDHSLWKAAVEKYITDSKIPFFVIDKNYGARVVNPSIKVDDLARHFNIRIRAFNKNRGYSTVSTANPNTERSAKPNKHGIYSTYSAWGFNIDPGTTFVISDLKMGALERAKHHFRNTQHGRDEAYTKSVYVLEPVDKEQPMKLKAFYSKLKNPPESFSVLASTLMEKPRKEVDRVSGKNVTIMQLRERGSGSYYRSQDMVWKDAGKADEFSSTETYYYLPLSGYNICGDRFDSTWDSKSVFRAISRCGIPQLRVDVYGVRKGDIEFIKTQPNWINLEDYIAGVLVAMSPDDIKTIAAGTIDSHKLVPYNGNIAAKITNPNSPYLKTTKYLKDIRKEEVDEHSLRVIFKAFNYNLELAPIAEIILKDCTDVYNRYPLIKDLGYRVDSEHVAEYINLIDESKGV